MKQIVEEITLVTLFLETALTRPRGFCLWAKNLQTLIKATPAIRHIPVIVLTAHARSTDREWALEASCDEYDTKPIDLARLLEKIDFYLKTS